MDGMDGGVLYSESGDKRNTMCCVQEGQIPGATCLLPASSTD